MKVLNRITAEPITELLDNEIFVYGSNLAGRNGAGAALIAQQMFGARYGVGFGPTGQCYAIPTKDESLKVISLEQIRPYVTVFIEYAKQNPTQIFKLTKIGCGLAGYFPEQIAPMFIAAIRVHNIHLPVEFWDVLNEMVESTIDI